MFYKTRIVIASSLGVLVTSCFHGGMYISPGRGDNPCANQAHMNRALENLDGATRELREAAHNKGGERTAALRAIEDARKDIFEGCRIANGQ